MTRLYASNVELMQVVENSHDVIKRCYLIYSSNMTVILKFIEKILEEEKINKKEDESDEKIYEKSVFKVQFDKVKEAAATGENSPSNNSSSGFKTNKRRERRKKITIRIKNFTKKRK